MKKKHILFIAIALVFFGGVSFLSFVFFFPAESFFRVFPIIAELAIDIPALFLAYFLCSRLYKKRVVRDGQVSGKWKLLYLVAFVISYAFFSVLFFVTLLFARAALRDLGDSHIKYYMCEASGGNARCGVYWDDTDEEIRRRYSDNPEFIKSNFKILRKAVSISQEDDRRTENDIQKKIDKGEGLTDIERNFMENIVGVRLYQERLIGILDEIRAGYIENSSRKK